MKMRKGLFAMLAVVALLGMSVSTTYAGEDYRNYYETYQNGVLIIQGCAGSGGTCLPTVIVT